VKSTYFEKKLLFSMLMQYCKLSPILIEI